MADLEKINQYLEYECYNVFEKNKNQETISIPLNADSLELAVEQGKLELIELLKKYKKDFEHKQKTYTLPPKGPFEDGPFNPRVVSKNLLSVDEAFQEIKKREKHESLKPLGFEHAPESFHVRRKEYTSTNNLEKLQWIHDNVSYNADSTMNILKLNKTFCEDISGMDTRCNWEEAKQLVASKGYTLGSDYNDCDSDEVKQQSDRYKVINVFSNGNGDTIGGMVFFRNMSGCNGSYWTATEHKDIDLQGMARCRKMLWSGACYRNGDYATHRCRVCGFKDAI